MMPALDDRKRRILQAVVREYIHSAEPVSSEVVLRRTNLPVSPATVRNEMAVLEDLGYLQQPHTSAGRVPTDQAYRFYIQALLEETELRPEERQRLRRQVRALAEEADRLIQRAARALAEEAHYASLAATPRRGEQVFRHLHLVPLERARVLPVLITDSGTYQGYPVDLGEPVDPDQVEQFSRWLSARLAGLTLGELTRDRLWATIGEVAHFQRLLEQLRRWLDRGVRRQVGRVIVEGAPHLLEQPEFRQIDTASAVLAALEREEVLLELLRPAAGHRVWVAIGSELPFPAMRECSIVAATYSVGDRVAGTLALLGPRRMHYDRTLPLVRFLADSLSEALTDLGG
jgi:heat-inducible transcriptional repressor